MKEILYPYNILYLFTLLACVPLVICADSANNYLKKYDKYLVVFIVLSVSYIFGSRDFDVGTDTPKYVDAYLYIQKTGSLLEAFSSPFMARDPFYNLISYVFSRFFDVRTFFYALAILFMLPIAISVFKLSNTNRALFLLAFLSLFCLPNLGINIIRNGLSLSFALLGLSYFRQSKVKLGYVFSIISLFFHLSSLIIFIVYYGSKIFNKRWQTLSLFSVSIIFAILKIGLKDMPVIGGFLKESERVAAYAVDNVALTSSLPYSYLFLHIVTIGYGIFIASKIKDRFYNHLVVFYIHLTSVYFLLSTMAFAYRFGILTWFFIPVILCYPSLNFKVYKNLQHTLLFTIILLLELFSFYQINASN